MWEITWAEGKGGEKRAEARVRALLGGSCGRVGPLLADTQKQNKTAQPKKLSSLRTTAPAHVQRQPVPFHTASFIGVDLWCVSTSISSRAS
jgi:hypothetical protein